MRRFTVSCRSSFILALLFAALHAHARDEAVTLPESVPGIQNVDATTLVAMLTSDRPPVVIDSRIDKGRDKGLIEGALHLPDIDTNCASLAQRVPDKSRTVVFFCSSSKCGRSLNAIKIARDCGYTQLLWFRGGFEEWQQAGFPYLQPSAPGH